MPKKEKEAQQITVEYAGMKITVPIILTSVTARDLELQKRAWLNAAEEAFYEYLYVNRLGRYSMIPKEDSKGGEKKSFKNGTGEQPVHHSETDSADQATPDNPK